MSKRIFFIWIVICINIFFYSVNSYANISTKEDNNFEVELYSYKGNVISSSEKEKIVKILQKTFGYAGDKLINGENTMRFRTKIKITDDSDLEKKKYIIQIGEDAREDDKDYKPITMPPKTLRVV